VQQNAHASGCDMLENEEENEEKNERCRRAMALNNFCSAAFGALETESEQGGKASGQATRQSQP
jgi:hypothetical protein